MVLGVYELLTELGFVVFCDWVAALDVVVFCDWVAALDVDCSAVTPANAALIRAAMSISDTLLFLDTGNSDRSLWMCCAGS